MGPSDLFYVITFFFIFIPANERRMRSIHWISICLLCCISINLRSQDKFHFEILPGAAYVFPSKLSIHQEGFVDIDLKAQYRVEPFKLPVYYSIRTGIGLTESLVLELEFNHLKIFLQNKPDEIQSFSISHGYNQFWIGLRKEFKYFDVRAGLGPVIAHPENTIRNMKLRGDGGLFNNGYYLDGVTAQFAFQKKIYLHKHFFLSAESKLNASFTRTNVVNGYADVSVFAVHVLGGIGVDL